MKTAIRELRKRYYLFVGTTLVVAIVTQILIYRYLDVQHEDAGLINTAGRQRMLAQRQENRRARPDDPRVRARQIGFIFASGEPPRPV